jgi:hypothetical protein
LQRDRAVEVEVAVREPLEHLDHHRDLDRRCRRHLRVRVDRRAQAGREILDHDADVARRVHRHRGEFRLQRAERSGRDRRIGARSECATNEQHYGNEVIVAAIALQ